MEEKGNKSGYIQIKNARVHNLKGVDLDLPRNQMIVITGVSGSGKSSLAFDTLYAEGQRRYVESLSSYVRQFLGRMDKPEVDYIKGIPPAIAIEQKVISNNPRSTVGTTTEIYEYMKLLYARIGHTISPVSGQEVKRHTAEDVINHILSLPDGTAVYLLTPLTPAGERRPEETLKVLMSQGFSRVELDGEFLRIADIAGEKRVAEQWNAMRLVIDRVRVSRERELTNRLYDSVETAFFEGRDVCVVMHETEDGKRVRTEFSKAFEADGIRFELPNDKMFAFNNPLGACPTCEGYGRVLGIDPDLVIPDKSLSVYQDAVACWRGETMGEWKQMLIANAEKFKFPIHRPYYKLTPEQQRLLWTGNQWFHGLDEFFKWVESQQYKIQYRVMLARYRGKTVCPDCHGTRLRREAGYVKVGGHAISELVDMPVSELKSFFDNLQLSEHERTVAARLLKEITSRIGFLIDVGLGYLTLNRQSNTLSGGESQRINLATSLGSSLVGSLYVLDEPSIGLHPRDTERLISVLRRLQGLGNTVVVVEHDEEIMRAADYIVDIGPEAGRRGGSIVMASPVAELGSADAPGSYTLKYLRGEMGISLPQSRRKWSNYIEIKGATQNNLKCIDVKFPLGVMTVVTGVSGSGKSSLVRDVLYQALKKHFTGSADTKASYASLTGSLHLITAVEMVDQNPIGKSSRSNPVTYLKAYDDIRKLFAEQPLSKQMGYTAAHFSFNVDGGRCEVCQGEGTVTVPMQFMADIVLPCEACHGTRFKSDILEVKVNGKSIHDVLEMSVNQAIEFFSQRDDATCRRIVKRLKPLQDVGIGYVKLGQASSTLSGGESQRVKLAYFLAQESEGSMFFIFDEPTTGLHTHDINTLLKAFDALIAKGHTVLIVEHNLHVIKCADHIIDIGPEGGNEGGNIVAEGTPEQVAEAEASYTGRYLREMLKNNSQGAGYGGTQ
ncbi:MAG: excinuclease ABC subunit UvrA [bacterium]|uniref:UvrABC system protein A n=1 Tax=Candidatus Aphodosoma intestinipullorum TaxID=2840674 RepID=A0A940DL33_9BACT|nr:excinuclease ABC subunit UvrA [Candidatus Aphodosoma intestinipullorum]